MNKSYVEEIRLCFNIVYNVAMILQNDRHHSPIIQSETSRKYYTE
jgi:hypothetical protein